MTRLPRVASSTFCPQGVAKDYAVRLRHDQTGVDEEILVYAGDPGNDRARVAEHPYGLGVVEGCRHFGLFSK